ncbi:MAG: DUF1573 domain-containing protein [Alistipes sp.]|nr:DUF1573 domain-containing protein [Alistipes sp.]
MKHLYKYMCLLIAILATVTTGRAQEAEESRLVFTSQSINFGVINEEDGLATRRFNATNIGDTEIVVTEIITTCGCTTVCYDRHPIPAGDSFSFDVIYDPRNRPGRFERNIFVATNDSAEPITLKIFGRVEPRERTPYEIYPFDFGGGLRLQSNFHAFAYIEHGKSAEEHIGYINLSERDITLAVTPIESSGALTVEYPTTIAPNATGDIVLRYSLDEQSDKYGTMSDIMTIAVDGTTGTTRLSAYAIATDNFDSVEDILAPKAIFSKKILKFGEILCANNIFEQEIVITNGGKAPLAIRRIESSSAAVTYHIAEGVEVAAAESVTLTVYVDTSLIEVRDMPFTARINIITNDPMQPLQVIKVNALPKYK